MTNLIPQTSFINNEYCVIEDSNSNLVETKWRKTKNLNELMKNYNNHKIVKINKILFNFVQNKYIGKSSMSVHYSNGTEHKCYQ